MNLSEKVLQAYNESSKIADPVLIPSDLPSFSKKLDSFLEKNKSDSFFASVREIHTWAKQFSAKGEAKSELKTKFYDYKNTLVRDYNRLKVVDKLEYDKQGLAELEGDLYDLNKVLVKDLEQVGTTDEAFDQKHADWWNNKLTPTLKKYAKNEYDSMMTSEMFGKLQVFTKMYKSGAVSEIKKALEELGLKIIKVQPNEASYRGSVTAEMPEVFESKNSISVKVTANNGNIISQNMAPDLFMKSVKDEFGKPKSNFLSGYVELYNEKNEESNKAEIITENNESSEAKVVASTDSLKLFALKNGKFSIIGKGELKNIDDKNLTVDQGVEKYDYETFDSLADAKEKFYKMIKKNEDSKKWVMEPYVAYPAKKGSFLVAQKDVSGRYYNQTIHSNEKSAQEHIDKMTKKNEDVKKGIFTGLVGNSYYVMKIKNVNYDDLTSTLPKQLDELKKVRKFMVESNHTLIGTKNKSAEKLVLEWVKQNNPSEFLAVWNKDHEDDATQIFYSKKQENESLASKVLEAYKTSITEEIITPSLSLDISRSEMPQINADDMEEFFKYLESIGCDFENSSVDSDTLIPSQNELDTDKADMIAQDQTAEVTPIIVSQDSFILDGHHRWLANQRTEPKQDMAVIRLLKDVKECLQIMNDFELSNNKDIEDNIVESKMQLSLIKNPSGTYGFVGSVPAVLAFIKNDGSEITDSEFKKIKDYQSISMAKKAFDVRTPSFKTAKEALAFAKSKGITDIDDKSESFISEVSSKSDKIKNAKELIKGTEDRLKNAEEKLKQAHEKKDQEDVKFFTERVATYKEHLKSDNEFLKHVESMTEQSKNESSDVKVIVSKDKGAYKVMWQMESPITKKYMTRTSVGFKTKEAAEKQIKDHAQYIKDSFANEIKDQKPKPESLAARVLEAYSSIDQKKTDAVLKLSKHNGWDMWSGSYVKKYPNDVSLWIKHKGNEYEVILKSGAKEVAKSDVEKIEDAEQAAYDLLAKHFPNLSESISSDTVIMPDVVADTILSDIMAFLYKDNMKLGEILYSKKDDIIEFLEKKAETIYKSNDQFKKSINAKGNAGRDFLYAFMQHWTAAYLKEKFSDIYKLLPASFAKGTRLSESIASSKASIEIVSGKKHLITPIPLMADWEESEITDDVLLNDLQKEIYKHLRDVSGFDNSTHYNLNNLFTTSQLDKLSDYAQAKAEDTSSDKTTIKNYKLFLDEIITALDEK